MIRLLVVDDSSLGAELISELCSSDSDINVIAWAKNGKEALEKAMELKPDLITMDIHMPVMDGLEATKRIMAFCPTPILILTSSYDSEKTQLPESSLSFKALFFGALDVITKPSLKEKGVENKTIKDFIEKIKLLSRIKVVRHPLASIEKTKSLSRMKMDVMDQDAQEVQRVVGIAASTGGPPAILEILKSMPQELSAAILIVQHISPGFTEGFVKWLDEQTPVKVKVGEHLESLKSGTVYVAPTGHHMSLNQSRKICLSDEPPVDGQIPSGTLLLKSIAEVYGVRSLGIVLTGMGKDGAQGLKAIRDAGGFTIAQDEQTSAIYGMPRSAAELGAAEEIMPLEKISHTILTWCS
jgi:two-component system chemotaxis response regulator CheB